MNRAKTKISIVSVAFLAVWSAFVAAGGTADVPGMTPLSIKGIEERGIEGRLGKRLGAVVKVSGEVVPNTSRQKAYSGEPFFLRIDRVDGRELETPQLFSSTEMPLVREVPELKVGDQFRCVGYESGGFEGIPGDAFNYIEPVATQGFHFAVNFVVVKAL